MKRKFLILTLCFTIIFTSINFNNSYANPKFVDGGVVSAPLVGTVITLAAATGLVLNSNEDIYKLIYDFRQSNLDNWNNVINSFNNTVSIGANGVVSVGKEFVNYVKDFLDSTYSDIKIDDSIIPFDILGSYQFDSWDSYGLKLGVTKYMPTSLYTGVYKKEDMSFLGYGRIYMYVRSTGGINPTYIMGFNVLVDGNFNYGTVSTSKNSTFSINVGFTNYPGTDYYTYVHNGNPSISNPTYLYDITSYNTIGGVYNPGNIETDDKIDVYVPGNLGDIIGNNYSDTPSYDLPIGGVVTVPGIENPSIDIDSSIPFPGVNVDDPSIPDVDVPGNDITVPSFPSFGDSLDFSPMYLTNVTEKFPFSLPWDIGRLIKMFDVEPTAPVFEVPIFSETITLDLTQFDELSSIVRFFVLIGFILSLIFISTKLMA